MAGHCIGIYLLKNQEKHYVTNLSIFNYFIRNHANEFMLASIKEIFDRSEEYSIVDMDLDFNNKKIYLVGVKMFQTGCFIITTEEKPHNHLISLAKDIIHKGLIDTIEKNFEYIETEIRCDQIKKELDEIKYQIVENIDALLERGEKMDDLVERTRYLSEESKQFYIHTKRLNRCCNII
jgi:transcriptional regulator of heat shock response